MAICTANYPQRAPFTLIHGAFIGGAVAHRFLTPGAGDGRINPSRPAPESSGRGSGRPSGDERTLLRAVRSVPGGQAAAHTAMKPPPALPQHRRSFISISRNTSLARSCVTLIALPGLPRSSSATAHSHHAAACHCGHRHPARSPRQRGTLQAVTRQLCQAALPRQRFTCAGCDIAIASHRIAAVALHLCRIFPAATSRAYPRPLGDVA